MNLYPRWPRLIWTSLVLWSGAVALCGAPLATANLGSAIWSGDPHQAAEPLFFRRKEPGTRPTADLLFAPNQLLRVRLANGTAEYPPADFRWRGRTVEYVGTKPLPVEDDADLIVDEKTPHSIANYRDGTRFVLFSEGHFFHDRQVLVDYVTAERWAGPHPMRQPLPALADKIHGHRPIAVALLGDSISTGANASGLIGVFPHQPAYFDLFLARLSAADGREAALVNFSVGGKTSGWGLAQVDRVIASRPDLIIIAFGMNDASGRLSADRFKTNVQTILQTARRALPAVEFVLISGMSANSFWNKAGAAFHVAYGRALAELAGPGVAVCDVESVWDYAVERKGFWSMTGNGVNHPNDFGHRLYADCLSATILDWPASVR